MNMILMITALASVVSDGWVAKATKKAEAVANCTVGPDCEAKWIRARRWIAENSRFTLVRDTDDLLLTHGALYADTNVSIVVVLGSDRDGVRAIKFRAWCGNFITCHPSPKSLKTLFTQAMNDISAP